jgi:hypothetical protein
MKKPDPVASSVADGIQLYRGRVVARGFVIAFVAIGLPILFVIGLVTTIVLINSH